MMMNAETIVERTQITAVSLAAAPVVIPPEALLQEWADTITQANGKAVNAIIRIGNALLAARAALPHGQWERLFKGHPQAVARPIRFSVKTALMYMKIAKHPILSNSNLGYCLPPNWSALYQLSFLPEQTLSQLIADDIITPELQKADAMMLRDECSLPPPRQMPVNPIDINPVEQVPIEQVRAHPNNYREHPEDQLVHIMQSLKEHGFYRNIVVARDYTILAGHGMVQAARRLGCEAVPVIVLDLDPDDPRALKVMISDNQISSLAEVDNGLLNQHLTHFMKAGDLLGTGFDRQQCVAKFMLERPPDGFLPQNEQQEWVALRMPACESGDPSARLMVQFRDEQDREQFVTEHAISITKQGAAIWSAWWPPQEPEGGVKWVQS